jgi:hypothetical protein
MAKYILVVGTAPVEGKEAAFNKWYDEVHLPELCAIPGVKSAKRFTSTPGMPGERPYLVIYDLETDDPMAIMAEFGRRNASGELTPSDAIDLTTAQIAIYKAY